VFTKAVVEAGEEDSDRLFAVDVKGGVLLLSGSVEMNGRRRQGAQPVLAH
jgi:hypothetical protein